GLDFEAQAREQGLKGEERRRFVGVRRAALQNFLDGTYGDPVRIAAGQAAPNGRVAAAGPEAERPVNGPNANHKRRLAATDFDDAEVFATFGAVLAEARALVAQHRFLHWEIVFPGIWSNWESHEPAGGFDGVVGNPPYLRQERLSAMKAELQRSYQSYHGAADLYVYFFERGLGLLAPGAHLSFVVTNKWLRAGYGAPLREFLATRGWIDAVIDFGHARQIFTQADVFPSVVVVRRPQPPPAPEPASTRIVVIPREQLRLDEIPEQVGEIGFDLPRGSFGGNAWRLDPPEVQRLMDKIRRSGVPLKDYAGVSPLYGIKTGLNEAFLIDTPTKERLCAADPASAEIIRPYLRGQDIKRWVPEWAGLWMIALKSSENHPWPWANGGDGAEARFQKDYPALHAHMKQFEDKLRVRQDHGRFWWELRSCSYYDAFDRPKTIYTEITWTSSFFRDRNHYFINNTAYILSSIDVQIVAALNAPLTWWYAWRTAVHGKDEALRLMGTYMEQFPLPQNHINIDGKAEEVTCEIENKGHKTLELYVDLLAWLKHEHGIEKPSGRLREAAGLGEDDFVREVRKARKGGLTPAGVRAVLSAYGETVEPLQRLKSEIAGLERRLSRLVEEAYGLTEEERALMWRTAPPRMPIAPPPEYAALTPEDAQP
ncbi:MAG: hypothetical protein GVY13_09690, partial [Alphaproteobacteria bacterium]|nr:hypothetical protein [Alphaproteobacteria bacterium]